MAQAQARRTLRARLPATRRAKTSPSTRQPPLVAVVAVCSQYELPDVAASCISAFVTAKGWTVELACQWGDLALLQRATTCDPHKQSRVYRAHVFGRALVHAVQHDNATALLECLRAYAPSGFASNGMEVAAGLGKLDVIQWLAMHYENDLFWNPGCVEAAAAGGHLETLQWLMNKVSIQPDQLVPVIKYAIVGGHVASVKWLIEHVERSGNALSEFARRQLLVTANDAEDAVIYEYLSRERGYECPQENYNVTAQQPQFDHRFGQRCL